MAHAAGGELGVTWVKIDDAFAEHPKIAGLSDGAFRTHVSAMCYAARRDTDGVIPHGVLRLYGWGRDFDELVAARVWEEHPDGVAIHDFLEFNPSREQKEKDRAAARERMEQVRQKRARSSGGVRANNPGNSLYPVPVPDPLPDPVPGPGSSAAAELLAGEPATAAPAAEWEEQGYDKEIFDFLKEQFTEKQWTTLAQEEAGLFCFDFAGRADDVRAAIDEYRRHHRGPPWPGKVRQYMPRDDGFAAMQAKYLVGNFGPQERR